MQSAEMDDRTNGAGATLDFARLGRVAIKREVAARAAVVTPCTLEANERLGVTSPTCRARGDGEQFRQLSPQFHPLLAKSVHLNCAPRNWRIRPSIPSEGRSAPVSTLPNVDRCMPS